MGDRGTAAPELLHTSTRPGGRRRAGPRSLELVGDVGRPPDESRGEVIARGQAAEELHQALYLEGREPDDQVIHV